MTELPNSATELFEKILPLLLQQHAARALALRGVYGFHVSGPGGGAWTVDLQGETPSVLPVVSPQAQCIISLSNAHLMDLLRDPGQAMRLFFQGHLKIDGDPMLAMKLQTLFQWAKDNVPSASSR